MTNMNPTLIFALTAEMVIKLQEQDGLTVEQAENLFREKLGKSDPATGTTITFERMRIVATNEVIEDYAGVMASRFVKDGVLHIIMNDGNVIPLVFNIPA